MKRKRRIRLEGMKKAWMRRMSFRAQGQGDHKFDLGNSDTGGVVGGKGEFIPLDEQ
jgi:hypothetical protein